MEENYVVRCNNCELKCGEESLEKVIEFKVNEDSEMQVMTLSDFNFKTNYSFEDLFEYEVINACPECLTDAYLMELEVKETGAGIKETYQCCVAVPEEKIEYYQNILDKGADYYKDNDMEFPKGTLLFAAEGTFENGWSARYEVYTGEESVLSSCYLYDANYNDVAYRQNDCSIESTTEFAIDNEDRYIFIVRKENKNK